MTTGRISLDMEAGGDGGDGPPSKDRKSRRNAPPANSLDDHVTNKIDMASTAAAQASSVLSGGRAGGGGSAGTSGASGEMSAADAARASVGPGKPTGHLFKGRMSNAARRESGGSGGGGGFAQLKDFSSSSTMPVPSSAGLDGQPDNDSVSVNSRIPRNSNSEMSLVSEGDSDAMSGTSGNTGGNGNGGAGGGRGVLSARRSLKLPDDGEAPPPGGADAKARPGATGSRGFSVSGADA